MKNKYNLLKEKVKNQVFAFLDWKKGTKKFWLLKVLILASIILGIVLLYRILPYLFSISILLLALFADQLENIISKIGNKNNSNSDIENDIRVQNNICVCSLFSILSIAENATIFNVLAPKVISDILPDVTKFYNPQQIGGNLNFYRFPVKINDENRTQDFDNLADTLNIIIAKKLQNSELENVPTAFYNDISSIQVLGIHSDMFNPAYIDFDLMYVDTQSKYDYIIKKYQLQQAHEVFQAAPIDEDF